MAAPSNFVDLTGKRFGRLTVISRAENKGGKTNWHCKCDCGNEKDVLAINLSRGFTQSCGCLHNEDFANRRFIDLSGNRYGKLTVIKRAENRGKDVFWLCKCDCGNTTEVNGSRLRSGKTKSCGCLRKETYRKSWSHVSRNVKHGKTNTRLYRIYKKMYRRCYCPETKYYKNYGGRGITICLEWLGENGFPNFYDWAMENGYKDSLSIDRIDNDKGYSPDNCRWATAKEQANNTRSTVYLTYKGETKPASEWAEITGIRQDTLTMRKRNGWSDEECIEIPVGSKHGKWRN